MLIAIALTVAISASSGSPDAPKTPIAYSVLQASPVRAWDAQDRRAVASVLQRCNAHILGMSFHHRLVGWSEAPEMSTPTAAVSTRSRDDGIRYLAEVVTEGDWRLSCSVTVPAGDLAGAIADLEKGLPSGVRVERRGDEFLFFRERDSSKIPFLTWGVRQGVGAVTVWVSGTLP